MMKITGLSHLFKWENLHNWWLTKYFFAPLYIYIYIWDGMRVERMKFPFNPFTCNFVCVFRCAEF